MSVIINNPEKEEKLNKELEEIKRKRGQIITWALEIEDLLEGILSNYFMKNANPENRDFFEIEVMREMNFEKKVQLFEKAAKKEKYKLEELPNIIKAIKNIQEMRNKATHWRTLAYLQSGEVRLRRKNEISREEMLSLNNEVLNKLEENKEFAFQEIIKFHQWHYRKD